MRSLFKSPVFAALAGGISFLATLFFLAGTAAAKSDKQGLASPEQAGIWNTQNFEVDQLVSELKKERDELREREANLNKLAEQLKSERAELDDLAARVKTIQAQFDKSVVQIKTDEQGNLKKQARIYASMTPDAAAQIMTEMEDIAVVKLFASMKEEESGSILESFLKRNPQAAKRAANLSEQLRRVLIEKAEQK